MTIHRAVRYGMLALAALIMTAIMPAASQAQSGVVEIRVTKAGFIVGVGGGEGVLIFQGRRYPLSIGGISVGATIGASTTDLIGRAHPLHQAADIAGTYTAIGSGVAVAGGVGSVRLRNERGVVLDLRGRKVGLEFSVNVSGMRISLR